MKFLAFLLPLYLAANTIAEGVATPNQAAVATDDDKHCKPSHKPRHKPCCTPHHDCHPKPPAHDCECYDLQSPYQFLYRGNKLPVLGPAGQFSFFEVGPIVTDDGVLSIANDNLVVNSFPFTKAIDGVFNRAKWIVQTNKVFDVPANGEISFQMRLSQEVKGLANQPFGNQVLDAQSDLRLGCSAFIITDLAQSIEYCIFVTNRKVYVLADRLGLFLPGPPAAYGQAIPVADVIPGQEINIAVNVNGAKKYVRYLIDGKEVFRLNKQNIGYKLADDYVISDNGGVPQMVWANQLQLVFGTIDYLDGYSPCNVRAPTLAGGEQCIFPANEQGLVRTDALLPAFNPRTGAPATYVVEVPTDADKLFGQGVVLNVHEIKVANCKN